MIGDYYLSPARLISVRHAVCGEYDLTNEKSVIILVEEQGPGMRYGRSWMIWDDNIQKRSLGEAVTFHN